MNALKSIDHLLYSDATYGMYRRAISTRLPSTTSANSTSGYINVTRSTTQLTLPSVAAAVQGYIFTYCRMATDLSDTSMLTAVEYSLGTLTVSGNSFASGVTMPTKTVAGQSVQTASLLPMAYVSASVTATTPVLTITYTNQAGTGSKSCAMTLPTNPVVGSAVLMVPHLAANDTGVQAVTNISISAGSAGTIKILGLLPIAIHASANGAQGTTFDPLTMPIPVFQFLANDVVSFWQFGQNGSSDLHVFLAAVADW
jgi:hypothetical protein